MPKLKPHKGLLKRVKVTAKGKIIRRQACKGHLMSTKSSRRRRRLGRVAGIDKTNLKVIHRMLAMK
jgi:large subunit ribosomal protein L35